MDEAREMIAADHDVSRYDALRSPVLAELGITAIGCQEVNWTTKYGGVVHTTHRKVASFDYEGYQRAQQACKALMSAMPEVDWAELAREDVRAIAEAGSLQSSKYKTGIKVAVIGTAIALA